jgi:glyoxylase-like metal-dependent hydrolase (beta-lactamase superfamily II)
MITIHSLVFNPFSENTYILYDETREALIIDQGCNTAGERQTLTDFIAKESLKPVRLLNTHCHIDHVFGNQFVKDQYNIQLYIHRLDVPTLESCPFIAQAYGLKPFYPSQADGFIEEGDKITFGNSELAILFVPGHAPGHIAFISHTQRFMVSGDVLFRESVGRTDFPGCNHQDLLNSIQQKLFPLGDDFTVYSGHGVPTTIGHERKYNPFVGGQ